MSSAGARIDAIAVIGMAFRFPGDVHDEASMWNLLKNGKQGITRISDDRWPVDALQHSDRSEPGRSVTFSAGVLSDIDQFDAAFFGISPREAAWLDPQQRLLLEMTYEALENAGVKPSSLAGSRCGVYVGISGLDYGQHALEDLASMSAYTMTGNTLSVAANRLSYVFDLHGPSMAVDTACSSSLVALHQACQALRCGEIPAALVGGVNLLMHPYSFIGFSHASMLSAKGQCRPFDAAADGYVRAEGGAALLLKPLDAAVRDGDPIQSVILATGVNADGARKSGLTIPSADAQEELMRSVLEQSGLRVDDIDFIEAHGTGTPVGDPVEVDSIGRVFGRGRRRPVPISSVKANVGHLEPASGMAGLVKAILSLKHGELPPMPLQTYTPNPHIDFAGSNVVCAASGMLLQNRNGGKLHAGVNSFGFGGVNAHVVLQSPPTASPRQAPVLMTVPPLFLSARTDESLRALALAYAERLEQAKAVAYYDIAYTAAFHRDRMEKRLAVLPSDAETAAAELRAFAANAPSIRVVAESVIPDNAGIVFVYTGNGTQWHGMGRTLYAESSCFALAMDALDAELQPLLDCSLVEILLGDDPTRLEDTTVSQPLLFAIQMGVTLVLREWGIEPHAVMGHSVGEIAAAWTCGALSFEQALQVIYARSQAQGKTKGMGRMAAMALSADKTRNLIQQMDLTEQLEIAGINSPQNVTLSGELQALLQMRDYAAEHKIFFRLLDLDYAFHSRKMESVRDFLACALEGLLPSRETSALFVSTVTGRPLPGDALTGEYWWNNVREAVDFSSAVQELASRNFRIFVEIGPHAILQRYIREGLGAANTKGRILPSLLRGDDGIAHLRKLAAQLHLLTDKTNMQRLFPCAGNAVPLPSYAWQKTRFWFPRTSECLPETRRAHPLLGWPLPGTEMLWENILDPAKDLWLADHKVGDTIVYPGAGYAEMALAAARAWLDGESLSLESLDITIPLVFEGHQAQCVRCGLNPTDGTFRIVSRPRLGSGEWVQHAEGRIIAVAGLATTSRMDPLPAGTAINGETLYKLTASLGLDYGPLFRVVRHIRMQGDRLDADITPLDSAAQQFILHPVALDACFHSLAALYAHAANADQQAFLPVKTGRLDRIAEGVVCHIRARLHHRGRRSIAADFELLDAAGRLVARAVDCRFRSTPLTQAGREKVDSWSIRPWLTPLSGECGASPIPPLERLISLADESSRLNGQEREVWFKQILPLMEATVLSSAFHTVQAITADDPQWKHDLSSPYARWLTGLLRDEGLLTERDGEWTLSSENELPPAEELWREAFRLAPQCLPSLLRVGRVSRRLRDILLGKADSGAVLEEVQNASVVRESRLTDPAFHGIHLAIKGILRHLAQNWPAHRRLRVLEVAAFPEGLTESLDTLLPRDRFDHVLALSDSEALSQARARFGNHTSVGVMPFDAVQGTFGEAAPQGPFDLVVLHSSLHRAVNFTSTLARIRSLLTPGGLLLAVERYPDWSTDFIEGLNPAWWHSDPETSPERPVSSLLSPGAWRHIIEGYGFSRCLTYAEPASEGLAEGAYLLLATSDSATSPLAKETPAASWLLLPDETSRALAEELRARLAARGHHALCSYEQDGRPGPDTDHVVFLRGHADTPQAVCPTLHALARCAQACAARETSSLQLWIVTCGGALGAHLPDGYVPRPAQCAVSGLGRVIMSEYADLNCTLLDVPVLDDGPTLAERLERELLEPDGADEILLTGQSRYTLRLGEERPADAASAAAGEHCRLDFAVPGRLSNLVWQANTARSLGKGEIEARVMATGLNFRDVMLTMGLLPDDAVENGFAGPTLGLEFAGIITRVGEGVQELGVGDNVVGFAPSCFASHVTTSAHTVARMPENWSHEAAATVPTVFFTAWYALKHLAQLQPGESLLIHGAAGGVGIAAIQIARHLGAEIFATAGSEEKRDFLRLMGVKHVFDSRSLSFADDIRAATGGQGVDVALNSLAGEAMRRSIGLLKPFGRFLELGKRDFVENTTLGLRPFKENISYFAIDADQLLAARPQLASVLFQEVMRLLRDETLTPLPCRVFPATQVVAAFRAMQQAQHMGKIVVTPVELPHLPAGGDPLPPLPLDGNATWLVTGGLSGFGLATARHLAERGVKHLVLAGRRGASAPDAEQILHAFTARGVNVRAEACDMADAEAVRGLINRIGVTMPPLKGVVHAAAVFDDRLLANIDTQSLAAVLAPKLSGAWHLHEATQGLPLTHFVLYSSISTALGNPGQGNYVAANAGLEGLTRLRIGMGLPAVCIAWGPIGDAGYLTRHDAVKKSLAQRLGRPPLTSGQAMQQLDVALSTNGQHIFANVDWSTALGMFPDVPSRFALVTHSSEHRNETDSARDIQRLLAGKSPEEVMEAVRRLIVEEVAQVLGLGVEQVAPDRSVQSMGLDSLMAVELAVGLEQRVGVRLPVMMLQDSPSVEQITERVVARLSGTARDDQNDDSMLAELARRHVEEFNENEASAIVRDAASGGNRL